MAFYKIWSSYKPTGNLAEHVGRDGELVIDTATDSLRMMDGVTPGGIPVTGGASSLETLSDVDVSTLSTGQVLQWNGTSWSAATVAGTFDGQYTSLVGAPTNLSSFTNDAGYITSFTETDPVFTASPAGTITNTNIANWNTAFGWGDHSTAGYLLNETVTSLSLATNILTYTNELGAQTNIDLSLYLDDTNLARLVSGTLDSGTGIATFTRDDASTFTVDFSSLLDQTITLTGTGATTVTGAYPNFTVNSTDTNTTYSALSEFTNDVGYITSYTETDPIYTASSWFSTTNNSTNWDTAFSWGDHAAAGYLTSAPTYALNDLTDVDTTGAISGSVLKYNGTNWIVGTDDGGAGGAVNSVNTLTGDVVLTTSEIAEGTNLYYTDTRVSDYLTANNYDTALDSFERKSPFFYGATSESFTSTVSSDGTTITLTIGSALASPSVDIFFSDGVYPFTVPASITLTPGTDIAPIVSKVWIAQDTKQLTVGTDWPVGTQYSPIADLLVPSAAYVQADYVYKHHGWTDHLQKEGNNGHLAHINYWIRQQPATWDSGVDLTVTINTAADPDNVFISTTVGKVLQLHDQTFRAFDLATGDHIHVINHPTTPWLEVSNLNQLTVDSNGNNLTNNNWANFVVWGVVNQNVNESQLMVNLPSAFYANEADALSDAQRYTNFKIPAEYTGVGFLIGLLTFRYSGNQGGTWTLVRNLDLRGESGDGVAGTIASSTVFADDTFRIQGDLDPSRLFALNVDAQSPGLTRTVSTQDRDGIMSLQGDNVSVFTNDANYIATDDVAQLTDLTLTGNLYVSGTTFTVDATTIQGPLTLEQVNEPIQTVAVASAGPITFSTVNGQLFYVNLPAVDWTANITNLSSTSNQGTNIAIVIRQGSVAYLPTALQIAGVATTINWQGGAQPIGTSNGIDVVNLSILNLGGTYTVLGQMVDF